jgi:hypothetical protein
LGSFGFKGTDTQADDEEQHPECKQLSSKDSREQLKPTIFFNGSEK